MAEASANTVSLSRRPAPISQKIPKVRLMVYGDGGVGKTTLALSFPKPIVIDTDGGLEGDAVIGSEGDEWAPEKWQDLNALFLLLQRRVAEGKYETVVIDSIDTLAHFILFEAMNQPTRGRKKDAYLTELVQAEQPDYGKVAANLERFLQQIRTLNVHVVLTSSVREPDPEKGRMRRQVNVQPALENVIEHWANIYGELVVEEVKGAERRILHTRSSDPLRKCKTRFGALRPAFLDPTFPKLWKKINTPAVTQTATNTKESK